MVKRKKETENIIMDTDYLSEEKISSSTDCTGLIPALPANEDDVEAYSDLYPIPKQGDLKDLKQQNKGRK